ncbi:MAG TPA: tetratricopeptide repeat protein [Pyrinomonadaceae bacterium]|jgi:tetratricopeptide (TPR) repeat protein/DNA-binding winged helix-turn-helix (wHTH) protein
MNHRSQPIYRLDGIEIDTSRACLKRDGQEQHLRQKTFNVLVYLLEQRQRLVTKNELIENFWAETAVTDNALEQCLAEIRKVLGDDSRHPRFIKTVPRAGYRFIGMVEEVAPEQTLSEEPQHRPGTSRAAEKSVKDIPSAETALASPKPFRWIARRSVVIWSAVILVAVFAFTFYLIRGRSSASPVSLTLRQDAGQRPVAVMFFDNQSGSADLDWLREGLADMLITDLSRSKNLSVLSRQQLHVLLDRIGHNESEKIRLDEALDVAQKSQAKILIMGAFARLGEQIRIDAQLHDARDGQLLAAERLVVNEPAQILTQVDLLSLKLASHLGAPSDQEANAGLTSVMTNNLEAYRYYSLGVEKAQAVRSPEAIALLQKAVALDSEFAMAYARLGYVYAVTWDHQDEGKPYLEKAFQLSGRLTEKDKLYITGWYAIANRDYPSAIRSFREIVAHFPLEVEAYRRLSQLLRGEEQFDEAIELLKQGLVIDSGAKDLYNALGGAYSDAGRHDEAITMFQRYVDLGPQEPNAHDSLASGYQWAGRYEEAIQEYQRALMLKPDFEVAIVHLGNAYFQLGLYREAVEQYRRYISLAPSDLERSRGFNCIAQVQQRIGKLVEAERTAKQAINSVRPDEADLARIFMITLEKGDLATAGKLEGKIESVYAQYSVRGSRSSQRPLLYLRGSFDLKNGRSAEAIENFKEALKHTPQTWNIDAYEDCLANVYLELGRLDEAITEYERILKLNPNYPLVHYHLAEAYERKGQPDRARSEYQRFLQVWKDADADIPEVVVARKALAGEPAR